MICLKVILWENLDQKLIILQITWNLSHEFHVIIPGSYKPCTHPHPPTLTHTHPHAPTPSQKKVTPTYNQPKKGLTHQHPPTLSQEKVTLT